MVYKAVVFDLYGTLVPPFRMRQHITTIEEIAKVLDVDFDDLHDGWVRDFPLRMQGEFSSVAQNLESIVQKLGKFPNPNVLAEAANVYRQFTIEGLAPKLGAIEFLKWLSWHEIRTGLVSNCSPDVVEVWDTSELARYFGYCAFSCQERMVKPNIAIYRTVLSALQRDPSETLYVGDGSDEELTGALQCGMQAVLFQEDLSNTYDAHRSDVETWKGIVVRSFEDLYKIITG